jgi:Ca2+-binding RTX toxin-like protein
MTAPTTSDFVGLADTIYNQTNWTPEQRVQINTTQYLVLSVNNDTSNGYYGAVLLDRNTSTLFVVNRGTDPKNWKDWATDAVMAGTDANVQWNDALKLAQYAEDYVKSNGGVVYTVGHSLGGTLAQLQAVFFGWNSVTFNAYGAKEVADNLPGFYIDSNANITNYRALFDLVSHSSTQIGTTVTLETPQDIALLATGNYTNPKDLGQTILSDHFISNFYSPHSTPSGSDPAYTESNMFLVAPSSRATTVAEYDVEAAALSLSYEREMNAGGPIIGPLSSYKTVANQVWQWVTGEAAIGVTAVDQPDPDLLASALDPSTSNNIYRASLAAGSPIVLQGVDPSTIQNDTLWVPGDISGLTTQYLVARNNLIQAWIETTGQAQPAGSSISINGDNSYVFTDFSQSSLPLYTLNGQGVGSTYQFVFADNNGGALSVPTGWYAELFGGAGDDTLHGGTVSSVLQGGAGSDEYVIDGSGTGVDHVLDTDGQGVIELQAADGTAEVLTGGSGQGGTAGWASADGKITYFENHLLDGTTQLGIRSGDKTVYVDDFTNGEFGITLNTSSVAPPSDALQVTLQNSLDPGVVVAGPEFDDSGSQAPIASVLLGPDDASGQIWAISGMSNAASIFGGTGSEWLLADRRTIEISGFVDASPIYIEAGSGAQSIIGGQGNDTLVGGSDTLTSVNLVFQPGTGPDPNRSGPYTVAGSQGFDWITGGGGDDLIEAGSGPALIEGGTGGDTIIGGSGNDTIFAGLSYYGDGQNDEAVINLYDSNGIVDDVYLNGIGGFGFGSNPSAIGTKANLIIAGSGDDLIFGSLGNDTIYGGSGHDTIVGNNGSKTIFGGSGGGVIYADDNEALAAADGVAWQDSGVNYSDTIYGGAGATTIYGSGGADYLYAGGGNDVINVGNGNSFVSAESGDVTINGGTGDEVIDGGTGNDLINTGNGNTYVFAGLGNSTVNAGTGNDTIEAGGGNDTFVGSAGAITYVIGTNTGADTVELGSGPTAIQLIDGLDQTNIVVRHVNNDLVLTDPVSDTQVTILGYFNGESNLTVNFQDGTVWDASQILLATMAPSNGGEDTLVGTTGNDSITAGVGDTLVVDSAGNNTLTGGYGSDTIEGGSGADTIEGGPGTTQMVGGTGLETYAFNLGDGSSTISESSASAGNDVFSYGAGIATSNVSFGRYGTDGLLMAITDPNTGATSTVVVQHYFSSATGVHQVSEIKFADGTSLDKQTVTGLTDSFYGDGTDGELITSTLVSATYYAGEGANVTVEGGSGNDIIYGGSKANTLLAGAGDDTLYGGIGADSISGGDGNNLISLAGDQYIDTVTGGSGNDTFDVQGASELLTGGGGTNTYVIDSYDLAPPSDGSRPDIVISDATASDTLNLVDVSSEGELSVVRSGSDLIVTVDGALDVTLQGVTTASATPSLTLSDGTTLTGATLYSLSNTDSPPDINGSVPNLDATEGLAFEWALPAGFFSDPDPNDQIASVTANVVDASGNLQPLPGWLQFDAATGIFSGTASQTDVGTQYTIRLTAEDTYGTTAFTQFNLAVVSDRAPSVNGSEPNQNLSGGQPFSIALAQGLFSDPDIGDALTYKAVAYDSWGNPVALPSWINFDPASLTFSGTVPEFVDANSYKLGVIATDLQGKSATSSFNINLSNVDVSPHEGSGWSDNEWLSQNDTLNLNVSTWVVGQGALTWSVNEPDGSSLPSWLHFDSSTHVFSATLTQAAVGDTPIELTVTDQAGATFAGSFTLHVKDLPDPPIATTALPDIGANTGQSVSWTMPSGLFTDADPGDQEALQYSVTVNPNVSDVPTPAVWSTLTPWLSYDPTSHSLTGTVPSTVMGSYVVTVTAKDPSGLVGSTSFHINVPNAPQVTYVNGTTGNDSLKGNSRTLDVIDGSAGNDAITGGKIGNWLLGGSGNDTLIGDIGADYLAGGDGTDNLQGGSGNDTLYGGAGADTLAGGAGNNVMRSDSYDTVVYSSGDGNDDVGALAALNLASSKVTITKLVVDYGVTDDSGTKHGSRVYLSNGNTIALHDYNLPSMFAYNGEVEPQYGGSAVSVLNAGVASGKDLSVYFNSESDGSNQADDITGRSVLTQEYQYSDYYDYSDVNDTIYGNAGDDTVMSGVGNDYVEGDDGNDALYGGLGLDTLLGGAGNDTLWGDGGWNESFVATGNNYANPGTDSMDGGAGDDTYEIDAMTDYFGNVTNGDDTITDTSGFDQIVFAQDDGVTESHVQLSGTTMRISDNRGSVTFDTTQIDQVVFSNGTTMTPAQWSSQAAVVEAIAVTDRSDRFYPLGTSSAYQRFAQPLSKFSAEQEEFMYGEPRKRFGKDSDLSVSPEGVGSDQGPVRTIIGGAGGGNPGVANSDPGQGAGNVSTGGMSLLQGTRESDDPVPTTTGDHPGGVATLNAPGVGGASMAGSYGRAPSFSPVSPIGPVGGSAANAVEDANTQVAPKSNEFSASGIRVIPTDSPQPRSLNTLLQPDEGTKAVIGAPADTLTSDPNDALSSESFGSTLDALPSGRGAGSGVSEPAASTRSVTRNYRGVHAASNVADSMVRALTAHGGLRLNSPESAAQIQLMDGTVWSLSSLDRTLAALGTGTGKAPNHSEALGSADLTHAQLINAMASFSPMASAESLPLLPNTSEAYAIAVAAQVH